MAVSKVEESMLFPTILVSFTRWDRLWTIWMAYIIRNKKTRESRRKAEDNIKQTKKIRSCLEGKKKAKIGRMDKQTKFYILKKPKFYCKLLKRILCGQSTNV